MTPLRKTLLRALAAFILPLLTACGDSDSFKVEGTVENLGTQNLRIVYSDGHALRSVISTAVDSKFNFTGNAPEETVVEVYSNARALIGRFVARNGDELNVTLKHDNPLYLKVKGNATSEALASFLDKNSGGDLNEAIARQVGEHPADPLSVILLTFYYNPSDPAATDSLIRLIDADAVPLPDIAYGLMTLSRRAMAIPDTIPQLDLVTIDNHAASFSPAPKGRTLYMFMDLYELSDTLAKQVKKAGFDAVGYIHTNNDTIGWGRLKSRLPDTAVGLLAPAGMAEPSLRDVILPQVPCFIVTDSVGAVQARTDDLFDALTADNPSYM